jgi:hypothetical protein
MTCPNRVSSTVTYAHTAPHTLHDSFVGNIGTLWLMASTIPMTEKSGPNIESWFWRAAAECHPTTQHIRLPSVLTISRFVSGCDSPREVRGWLAGGKRHSQPPAPPWQPFGQSLSAQSGGPDDRLDETPAARLTHLFWRCA